MTDNAVIQTGIVQPDDDDVLTLPQVQIQQTGVRVHVQPTTLAGVEGAPLSGGPQVQLSRNPIRDWAMLGVRWAGNGPASIALYDAEGRRVKSVFEGLAAAGREERVLSTAGLAPGMYVVVARQGTSKTQERVVIVR